MRRMTLGALVAASALTLAACDDGNGGTVDPDPTVAEPAVEEPLEEDPPVDVSPAAVTPVPEGEGDADESPAA